MTSIPGMLAIASICFTPKAPCPATPTFMCSPLPRNVHPLPLVRFCRWRGRRLREFRRVDRDVRLNGVEIHGDLVVGPSAHAMKWQLDPGDVAIVGEVDLCGV